MKKISIKTTIAMLFSAVLLIGLTTPALAIVDETQNMSANGTGNTEVFYEQGSSFSITIPKKITLNADKTSTYDVTVTGDISSDEEILVVPEETFLMKDQATVGVKKADVTATVEQDKTTWKFNEFNTKGNGLIEAYDLTSGNWAGTFWFNLKLQALVENEATEPVEPEAPQLPVLSVSTQNVTIGLNDKIQINAFLDGVATSNVDWVSDNENISVINGFVEPKATAAAGDSATITVTDKNDPSITTTFTVTIIDIGFSKVDDSTIITSLDMKAGETADVKISMIPDTVSATVTWSTASAGVNLTPNGNTVSVKVADDMTAGTQCSVIASYGTFSKILTINIVE